MFTNDNFVQGQVIDMHEVLVQTTPVVCPFTTFLSQKTVPAEAVTINWIEEEINEESAVTMEEGGDSPDYKSDSLNLMDNYCELLGATAKVSNTAQAVNAKAVNDLLAHEVSKKTKAIKLKMEDRLINGVKDFDSTNKIYKTGGILEQINSSYNSSLTPLSAKPA